MLDRFQAPLALLARVLLAVLFVPAGLSKLAGFEGTVGYIGSVGLPLPALGAVLAIVVEVGGGLALLVGWQTRWVALLLAGFTFMAGVFFHAFWAAAPADLMVTQIMFMKNVAIAGGLLAIAAFGAGALSVDAKRAAR